MKKTGVWLLVGILALLAAFLITVITFPVWRWFEEITGIESYGHSGPAEWCYWFVYVILILIMIIFRQLIKHQEDNSSS